MTPWSKELVRYIVVGLINTTGGLALIYVCMAAGLGDIVSNLTGYVLGFIVSFFLNGKWTFRRKKLTAVEFARFLSVLGMAYLMNLGVMLFVRDVLGWGSPIAQMAGVMTYAVLGYVGMKYLTFRTK